MFRSVAVVCFAITVYAPAQAVPVSASAGLVVQAGAQSSALVPGADITAGAHLSAGGAIGAARFDFAPSWNVTALGFAFDLSSTAFAQTSSASGGSTRHELWLARPTVGRLVITWTAATTGNGAAAFALDLHDDGVIEATAAAVLPVTLPAGLTVLRVQTSASASAGIVQGPWGMQIPYQGTAQVTLMVRLEPTHCTMSTLASSCAGPVTSVRGNFLGGVTVSSLCAATDDIAIAVFGFDQLATGLPLPPGCSLATTPLASHWRSVGTTGAVDWSTALPQGFGPVQFATQVIGLDVDTWSAGTSQAFWVTCQ